MAESETEDVSAQIQARIADLERVQKQLKRPSTIAFAERQALAGKAAKALAELQARRGGSSDEGSPDTLKEALAAADKILGQIGSAQPAGLSQGSGMGMKKMPGENRRGAAGSAQVRPPDRKGGDS